MLGERVEALSAQGAPDQRIVSKLGVGVQGQVVGGHRQVAIDQDLQSRAKDRIDGSHTGSPEEPVVDQQQLCALLGCQPEELGVGRDARGECLDLTGPWNLQTVDTVVLETPRIEHPVGLGEYLGHGGSHRTSLAAQPVWDTRGASGRGAAW